MRHYSPRYFFVGSLAFVFTGSQLGAANIATDLQAILPSNINSQPLGSESALMASTGVARGDGIDAPWANPAGLGVARPSGLEMSGTVYQLSRTSLEGDNSSNDDYAVRIIPSFTTYSTGNLGSTTPWSAAVFSVIRADWSYNAAISQVRFPAGTGLRYQLDTNSSYFNWEGGISAGMTVPDAPVRLGATIGATYNSYNTHLATMIVDQVAQTSVTGQLTESVTVIHVRPSLGIQYDPLPNLTLGATIRLTGAPVWERGRIDGAYQSISTTSSTFLLQYDDDVDIDWPVPGEAITGASWQGTHVGLSGELRWTGSRGGHNVIHSDVPATGSSIANGGSITPQTSTVPDEKSVGTATVGWALGAWYELTARTRLLGGLWYDPSPTDSGDTLFLPINMYGATVGTGFTWERSDLVLGIAASWGKHEDSTFLPNLTADVRVLNVSAVIATHVAF